MGLNKSAAGVIIHSPVLSYQVTEHQRKLEAAAGISYADVTCVSPK